MTAEQLELALAAHQTTVYQLARLWGLDRTVQSSAWFAWRCTCGRDVGAERRAAFSGPISAGRMAWWHQRDNEPWLNPIPGPPV